MSKFTKGVRVVGSVVEIREFGAIVESGERGESGLLHESRVRGGSRGARGRRLQALAIGEQVEVDVLDVVAGGKQTKVTLSELWADERVIEQLEVGCAVSASVARSLDCGLIVTIDDGVAAGFDGFLHVSELSDASREARDKRLAFAKIGDRL